MDTERLGYIPSNILPPFSLHFPPILQILKEFFHPDSFHLFHYVPTQYNTLYSHPVSTDITPLMQIIPICTPYLFRFFELNIYNILIFSAQYYYHCIQIYKYKKIELNRWICGGMVMLIMRNDEHNWWCGGGIAQGAGCGTIDVASCGRGHIWPRIAQPGSSREFL